MSDERLDFIVRLVDQITGPARGATKSLEGIDKTLKHIAGSRAFRDMAKGAAGAGRAMRGATKDAEKLQKAANLSMAAGSARRVGDAAMGIAAAPVKEFMGFDQAMSRVKALTSDFTEEQRLLARQLGETTRYTATEAATAMGNLGMAGFDASEQMQALGSVLSLDTASGMENLGESASIVARTLRGFGLEASKTGHAADVMTAVFTNSNTTLAGLGETMSYVAPVAAAAGIPLEDVAKAAGMLGDAGIDASRAGTTLRLAIANLAGASPPAAKELARLGVSTKDAAGNMLPLPKIMADIGKATDGMGTANRIKAITKIFGLRGAPGGVQLARQIAEAGASFEKMERAMEGVEGTTDRVATTMSDNLAHDVKILESAFSELKIEIGSGFNEELRSTAKILANDVLPGITQFAKEHKTLTKVVGGGIAVGGAASSGIAGATDFLADLALAGAGFAVLKGKLGGAWGAVVGFIGQLRILAAFAATSMLPVVKSLGVALGRALVTSIASASVAFAKLGALAGLVVAGVLSQWEPIAKFFDDVLPQKFHDMGGRMVEGLISGWREVFGPWESEIVNSMTGVTKLIERIMGIHSPSRVMAGIGENMAAGLNQGFVGDVGAGMPGAVAAGGAQMAGRGATSVKFGDIHITVAGGSDASADDIGRSVADQVGAWFDQGVAAVGG